MSLIISLVQASQVVHLNTLAITSLIAPGLVVIALWLWMAWANRRGRNWARMLSTVLFGLATVISVLLPLAIHARFRINVDMLVSVLTWLVGLAAVWLRWRPAASAFFKSQGFTQAWLATPKLL